MMMSQLVGYARDTARWWVTMRLKDGFFVTHAKYGFIWCVSSLTEPQEEVGTVIGVWLSTSNIKVVYWSLTN